MIYSYVKADGKVIPIESEKPLGLADLQRMVGGYIEFTEIEPGVELCVNEEGLIRGLPRNARYPMVVGDVVVGRTVEGPEGSVFVGLL